MNKFLLLYTILFLLSNAILGKDEENHYLHSIEYIDKVAYLGQYAYYLELEDDTFDINDFYIHKSQYLSRLKPLEINYRNLNFTDKSYLVYIKLHNNSIRRVEYFLETARPVTDYVTCYILSKNDTLIQYAGDRLRFRQKSVYSRKQLFRIEFAPYETKEIILYMKSDGEVLNVPLNLWNKEELIGLTEKENILNGLYYGFLICAMVIFTFFYFALKQNQFIYFVSYILWLFMMQFSLDGFTHKLLFPDYPLLASKMVLISACLGVMYLALYVRSFLKLSLYPLFFKVINFYIYTCFFLFFVTIFSEGKVFALIYPVINGLTITAVFLIFYMIYKLYFKYHIKIDPNFIYALLSISTGTLIFLMGNINVLENTLFVQFSMKLGSGMEVAFLSVAMANKYREYQEEKEKAQAELLKQLQETNKIKEEINIQLEKTIEERTKELKRKNEEIFSSLRYARRIQEALNDYTGVFKSYFPDSFAFVLPRDIVSGDFVWINTTTTNKGKKYFVFALADCTGHGVPGAMMSILATNILNQSLREPSVNSPAEALYFLDEKVNQALKQINQKGDIKDGLDIALCGYDTVDKVLYYAGAKISMLVYQNNELKKIKASRCTIGYSYQNNEKHFENIPVEIQPGDCIYLFSDGIVDQFNEEDTDKFKISRLKETILKVVDLPMELQKEIILKTIESWKGKASQTDDISMIGIRFQ